MISVSRMLNRVFMYAKFTEAISFGLLFTLMKLIFYERKEQHAIHFKYFMQIHSSDWNTEMNVALTGSVN